jgi:hypothetical protein
VTHRYHFYSCTGLVVSAAEEFLRLHCPSDIEIVHFEFYNSVREKFELLSPSNYLEENTRLYPVLAKTLDSGEDALRIEGRAFDISEGLFVGSRALRIEEKVNRSEGIDKIICLQ